VLHQSLDAGLRYRPRIRAGASTPAIVAHFRQRFGLDVRHQDEDTGRAVEVGARPLAWPEAQRLDQLLRQAPARLVRGNPGLEALVLVDRNTVLRKGAYRSAERRIVVYRSGQSLVAPDELVPGCSVFAATVAHELGEAAWDSVLTDGQRERFATAIATGVHPRPSEEFADHVMRGLIAPHMVVPVAVRAFLRELGLRL
jgi:hypothetical protein